MKYGFAGVQIEKSGSKKKKRNTGFIVTATC